MLGLEIEVEMRLVQLKVHGDSQQIINQFLRDYEVRNPELLNNEVNSLANLASALAVHEKEIWIQYVKIGSYHLCLK
ncbi:hypothetical protein LIER_39388 [Lithospermum erythrorhizon]|uniref:Uncharacterized protein n=1 Tax=Lithospermum erythrorhizon TaxID=34254 RepID=A0AAV3QGA9_LITER